MPFRTRPPVLDVHCVTLVKDFDLATVLASRLVVQAEVAKAKKGAPGETARILHALLSLLKNLSIAGKFIEPPAASTRVNSPLGAPS